MARTPEFIAIPLPMAALGPLPFTDPLLYCVGRLFSTTGQEQVRAVAVRRVDLDVVRREQRQRDWFMQQVACSTLILPYEQAVAFFPELNAATYSEESDFQGGRSR